MLFGYNGRDGVITDENSLLYMRARYYSPDMKRFVNADIIPGEISNAITINRFAYANGNPVSFVDPFGLSAASPADVNWTKAYMVTSTAIPVAGHTVLFFSNDDGSEWFYTEYTLPSNGKNDNPSLIEMAGRKSQATIFASDPVGNNIDLSYYGYVELTGNFNNSVAKAIEEDGGNFNEYDLASNNCGHYGDYVLQDADVDGLFTQIMVNERDLISVPRIRQMKLSIADYMDDQIRNTATALENLGDSITSKNFVGSDVVGNVVKQSGQALIETTNAIGDAVGAALKEVEKIKEPLKEPLRAVSQGLWGIIKPVLGLE